MTALIVPDHVSMESMIAKPKLEGAAAPGFVAKLETPPATEVEYPLVLEMA